MPYLTFRTIWLSWAVSTWPHRKCQDTIWQRTLSPATVGNLGSLTWDGESWSDGREPDSWNMGCCVGLCIKFRTLIMGIHNLSFEMSSLVWELWWCFLFDEMVGQNLTVMLNFKIIINELYLYISCISVMRLKDMLTF